MRYSKWVPLPVYSGLCHASHIYNIDDVRSVLGDSRLVDHHSEQIPLFSTGTGKKYNAKTGAELFEQVILELLTSTIRWDSVISGVINQVSMARTSQVEIFVSSPMKPVKDLGSKLESSVENLDVFFKDTGSWMSGKSTNKQVPRSTMQSKIAIVGMSCRFPGGANSLEEFWNLLEQGLDVHQQIAPDRFSVETHYDPTGKKINSSKTPYGCFIEKAGMFDAGFLNMSPREAEQTGMSSASYLYGF